ncbi:MAG: hypothetical protein CSA95_09280 [Bacteroidetes bacterium]|nr:MAG: hypothetical protein CSA95_09280 [Bacteroidota bacterium]
MNILSVYNKNMNSKNPFKEEKQIISKYTTCKYNSKEPKNEYDNDDFDKNKSNLDKLNNIEISITPSGYSLIKFILIHFEYYSNRIRNDNESLKHPLFYLGLKKAKDGKYLFEHKIDSVLELIKKEAKDNFFFFSKIFREKNRITPEEFEESNMAFKYFSENRKSNKGCFHLTRIISSQIAYIDKFRLYLINKDSLIDMQQITNINNLLIKYIKNYLSILEKYSLDSRKSIILGEIAKQIQIIENTFDKNSGILVPNHEE